MTCKSFLPRGLGLSIFVIIKGSPDIVIQSLHKKYNGLVIEFKSPNGHGIVSAHQDSLIERYRLNGYKTDISP